MSPIIVPSPWLLEGDKQKTSLLFRTRQDMLLHVGHVAWDVANDRSVNHFFQKKLLKIKAK